MIRPDEGVQLSGGSSGGGGKTGGPTEYVMPGSRDEARVHCSHNHRGAKLTAPGCCKALACTAEGVMS